MNNTSPSPNRADRPTRILIVRPSALGDVCRTVPVLASVRRAFPDAVIDWVVQDTFVEAVRGHPDLNDVLPFPRHRFSQWWRSPRVAREIGAWVGDVRRRSFDLVLDLQGLGRSGLITRVTGAARRVGFRNAREGAWLGYNVRHDPPVAQHIVDQMLELLAREGIPPVPDIRLYVPEDVAKRWRERSAEIDVARTRYAVLSPTSRWASKRWPLDNWIALIDPLRARGFERFIIVGAPDERAQVDALRKAAPEDCIDLVGSTSVGEMMALIRDASLVVANDSAPLHMAVGFDRPLIALFGPTNPDRVGPYHRDESVVQPLHLPMEGDVHYRDTDDALMRQITVTMVIERVDRLSAAEPAASTPAENINERSAVRH